jgi:putative redox protein
VTPSPPTIVDLVWIDELRFSASSRPDLVIDSRGQAGPSPVQALALALAGCMSVDLAHILAQGRHTPRAMRSRLVGDRAQEDPHRFLRIALHFTIEGDIPVEAIERAVGLSCEKYCSVWHSMRQDIDFRVTFDLVPGRGL